MADILIKGLELPTEERISLSIYPNGIVVNHSTLKIEKNRTTAIELPHHGRLVDEEDLRNRAYAIQRRDGISFPEALALALIYAPTIVEANV